MDHGKPGVAGRAAAHGAPRGAGQPDRRGSWLFRPGAQLGKYSAMARVTTRTNLAYLADLFVRSLFMVVVMYVFVQLWRTTYGSTGSAAIGGLELSGMIWYLAITETLVMSMPRVNVTVDEQVKTGQLAYFLTRPHSYILYLYATYLGETAVRLPIYLLLAGGVAWLAVGPPPLVAASLPGLALTVLLALTINFVISAAIGLLAFWFEDTNSFYLLYSRFLMIAGGMLIPLDVFPDALRRLTTALPTNLIVYRPARYFVTGGLDPMGTWGLLGQQLLWLAILGLGLFVLYRTGVKRVNVQGG